MIQFSSELELLVEGGTFQEIGVLKFELREKDTLPTIILIS